MDIPIKKWGQSYGNRAIPLETNTAISISFLAIKTLFFFLPCFQQI